MSSKRNPGHPTPRALDVLRVCSVPGCGRKHNAKGYCSTHYMRQYHGRPLTLLCEDCGAPRERGYSPWCDACREKRATAPPPLCAHAGCKRAAWRVGVRFCSTHHARFYHNAPMDSVCPGCGKPVKRQARCRGCKRRAQRQKNANWFQRKKASDPAWWAARKAKIAAAYHAKKAAQSRTTEAA